MNILALDLGRLTGWAYDFDSSIQFGTWELAKESELRSARKLRLDRRLDPRIVSFLAHLNESARPYLSSCSWLVFEDVRFAESTAQCQLWASFRGALWAFADRYDIRVDCLETGKLKMFTTGRGDATKEAMEAYARRRWPDCFRNNPFLRPDDNAVDALCLLKWAKSIFKT